MADVKFEVTRVQLPTSGTLDVTISGFGTPKAAIFIATDTLSNGAFRSNASMSVGFTDGSRHWTTAFYDKHGQSNTLTSRLQRTGSVVSYINSLGTGTFLNYTFNSWITDGVRINWGSGSTSANRYCTVILIGGSDVADAYVNYIDDLGTSTAGVSVTDPSFQPNCLFVTGSGNASAPPAVNAAGILTFGAAIDNGSSIEQAATLIGATTSVGVAVNTAYTANDAVCGQAYSNNLGWKAGVSSFDTNGFTLTPTASAGNDIVGYLALRITNNPDLKVKTTSVPASGSTYSESGIGFEPSFGLVSLTGSADAINTVDSSSVYSFSASAFDASSVFTESITSADAATITKTSSYSADKLAGILSTPAVEYEASSYSFDSDGWDFTLASNPAGDRIGFLFAVGDGAGGGTEVTADTAALTLTTYPATISLDVSVDADTASLTITENPATVSLDVEVSVDTAALTLTTYPATVSLDVNVDASTAALTITEHPASITLPSGIVAGTAELTLTTYPATVSLDVNVDVDTAGLTLTTHQASIITGVNVDAGTVALDITTYPATIEIDTEVGVGTVALSITTHDATITSTVLTVTCRLVDVNGNALPNLSDLSYAWFDQPDPANFTTPVVQGGVESTDGTGEIVVPISGTSLTTGQTGTLVLRSDDGTLLGAYNLAVAA
jgi:hypothetical protein